MVKITGEFTSFMHTANDQPKEKRFERMVTTEAKPRQVEVKVS